MQEFDEILAILLKYKNLGIKDCSNGTRLIGRTPHVAPLAYLHTIFLGLEKGEIRKLKNKLGVELPGVYEEFLREHNGIRVYSGNLALNGYIELFERDPENPQPFDLLSNNPNGRPRDSRSTFFFIGSYRQDGSLLYIDNDSLNVYRCARESAKPLNEWWDFWDMLSSEVKRLDSCFDASGYVLRSENLLPTRK